MYGMSPPIRISLFLTVLALSIGSISLCSHAASAHLGKDDPDMKINILGFRWKLPAHVTLAEIFTQLQQIRGAEEEFAGHSRLVFVGETRRYHTGLLLTSKTNRRFCELRRQRRGFHIDVREVAAGNSLVDFNFFVMHKQTARGLYQYHHQSFHPNVFSRFCGAQCAQLQQRKIAEAVAQIGGAITERQRHDIEQRFSGALDWSLLIRPENFEAIVRQLQRISDFHFNFTTVEAEEERLLRGFRGVAQLLTHKVTFRRSATVAQRARAILDFVGGSPDLREGAVVGVDQEGLQKTINLFENPDSFGSFEFDAVTQQITANPEEFANAPFLQNLIRIADDNRDILEAEAE